MGDSYAANLSGLWSRNYHSFACSPLEITTHTYDEMLTHQVVQTEFQLLLIWWTFINRDPYDRSVSHAMNMKGRTRKNVNYIFNETITWICFEIRLLKYVNLRINNKYAKCFITILYRDHRWSMRHMLGKPQGVIPHVRLTECWPADTTHQEGPAAKASRRRFTRSYSAFNLFVN
jgi:hypothetical protein